MKTTTNLPQNFIYNENHYYDLGDLMSELELEEKSDIEALEEDWFEMIQETQLEPLDTLDAERILECISEDRMSEDGDELERLKKVLNEHIDFDKINEKMPKLYYWTGFEYKLTKQDLLDYIN